jgi:chaperonin GroES
MLSILDILDPDNDNLVDILDKSEVTKIGSRIISDVEIDKISRGDWLIRYDAALDSAMQVRKVKTTPWLNASNIKYPQVTVASLQFQARAYPAIVDGSNLVKGRVLGPDPDGIKRARADRIAAHMTWQLMYRMDGWEEDTDRLLLMLPIVGCVFRKSYYDPLSAANRSDMVTGSDFIINYWAKSLDAAPRYTHVLHMYPYEVKERIAAGIWAEIHIDQNGEDEDALVDFYEHHCMMDLDDDGLPEPYVVTCNMEGQVARIVPCFGLNDVTVNSIADGKPVKASALLQDSKHKDVGKIVRIVRRQYFVKYGFIPAPDGSFYDIGFGTLLADISASIDTVMNQMIDAGTLQNAQGGWIANGVTMKSGNMSFRSVGEWKRVDTGGALLRDSIVPLQLPGPSPVLFNLLGMLIQAAKEVTSIQDVMTGQGTANQPATTTLALIEQGQKVMTSIFKRIHRAFGQELRILRRLNKDFLDDQEYFQLNDGQDAMDVSREDYEDDDLDVLPVSDPTAVSDMQKMARAEATMIFRGDPKVNQDELYRRYLEATGQRDAKALLTPEGPPPVDPKVIIEGAKIEIAKAESKATIEATLAGAAKQLSDAAAVLEALGLIDDAALLAAKATELGYMNEPVDEPGQSGGMEGQSADQGLPSISDGPPQSVDGGMGEGGLPDGGATGGGGDARQAGGPIS